MIPHLITERRGLEVQHISNSKRGNQHIIKVILVVKPPLELSIHAMEKEVNLGVLEHILTLTQGRGKTKEMLVMMGWSLRREAEHLSALLSVLPLLHQLTMNILVWNCRGALKPNFQSHVKELAKNHNPAVLVVMETCIGGDRAKEITDRLPFNGAIHMETIGFAGGIWLLWNSNRVEVVQLANTEQEIHVEVKVFPSNLSWIFTAVYANPRYAERQVLWENLSKVADHQNKPWIIAGDFNEPLAEEDKFGGRPVNINRSLLFKECLDKCNMVDMGFNGLKYT